ncbi:J domain-containing protein [Bdellovibrionota bacterium FG-2]
MSRRRRIIRYQERTLVLSNCRDLILIEAEPIKKAEEKKCKDMIHQMDLARDRLRRFNEESQPAFQQWLHSQFGKEISELRELAQKLHELQRLSAEVEDYKFSRRCNYRQAYEAIMDRRNHPEAYAAESERHDNPFDDPFEDYADEGDEFENDFDPETAFRAAFDSLFEEDPEHDFHKTLNDFDELDRRSEQESAAPNSRLKTLYRALARKLHPDVNTKLDQKHKDLWHQVQDAYEGRDIERLETLSALSELFDENTKSVESISSLKNLYEELRSGLRHLQRQINRCNKDMAWSFEKTQKHPKKMQRLREKIASQMRAEKSEILDYIAYGERQIQQWKTPPPRKVPKPKASKAQRTYNPIHIRTKADMDTFTGFGKT